MDVAGASIPESGTNPQLPPLSVRLALGLFARNTALYVAIAPMCLLAWRPSMAAAYLWFTPIVPNLVVNIFIYFHLKRQRNWARVLFIIWTIFSIFLAYFFTPFRAMGWGNDLWWFITRGLYHPLNVVTAVLLYSPLASQWFALKRQPGVGTWQ
jgi:hypothetical protein